MWKRIASFTLGLCLVIALGYKTAQAQIPPITPIPISLSTESYGSTYIPEGVDQSDTPSDRGIVGNDDRLPVKYQGYFPWSAIGRIDWVRSDGQEIGQCTGTLVGRDLILTNSHCLGFFDENDQFQLVEMLFKPNLVQGVFTEDDKATVIDRVFGWDNDFNSDSEDWALLRIDKPLGDTYGYLGWRQLDLADPSVLSALQNQVRLAGYSGDYPSSQQRDDYDLGGIEMETAGIHLGCNLEGIFEGVILHSCDTTFGASGSSILAKFDDDNYYVIGLHAGYVPLDETIIFEGSSQDECTIPISERGEMVYENIGECFNRGVEVSRWASQATALRTAE